MTSSDAQLSGTKSQTGPGRESPASGGSSLYHCLREHRTLADGCRHCAEFHEALHRMDAGCKFCGTPARNAQ